MRTTLLFFFLFLTSSLSVMAATNTPDITNYCLSCNVPGGLAASNLTGTSAVLTWNAVAGATTYNIEVEDEQNNPSTFHIEANATGTSYTVTGLQPGVMYKFKVRTRCGNDKSDWSEWVSFVSAGNGGGGNGGGGGSNDCAVVTGLSTSVVNGAVVLSWTAVSNATQYYIEVEDEQNNPSTFHLEDFSATNSYTLTGLQTGVLYKFKVRAHCGSGQSVWSAWFSFNGSGNGGGNGGGGNGGGSNDCAVVTGLSTSVVNGAVVLSWTAVSNATQYYIEVEDEQNNPSTFHLEDFSATNSYTLTGLQTGVLYKFKVRAHCGSGQSVWSDWFFFNGSGNGGGSGGSGGGSGGTCTAPSMLSANVNGSSATLSWNKVAGATQYYIEVEDEQNTPSTLHLELAVQDSFYTVTGLQAGVLYKFKVRTHCGSGQSAWSNWLFFNGNSGGNAGGGGGSVNCSTPTNILATNISAVSALLVWNAVPGASSYTLEIERTQGNTPWKITQVVQTNSFLVTGLNPNTRYKFKVRTNCAGSNHSDWTQWRKFKTILNVTGGSDDSSSKSSVSDDRSDNGSFVTEFEVQIWPNPIHANASVLLQNLSAESTTLRLIDLTGHLVQAQQILTNTGDLQVTLPCNDLPNGMYFLQIQNGENTRTSKLVVAH